jgi:hypothetical protein
MPVEQADQVLLLLVGAILIEGFALTILSYLVLKSKGEPPKIQEVFTILSDGRLLINVGAQEGSHVDDDIFAGMLTVVRDFMKDSFKSREATDVKKIEFGKKRIFLEKGENIFLAVVYTGDANEKMRKRIINSIEHIELKFKDVIEDWDGDLSQFEGLEDIVTPLLDTEN